MSYVSLWRVLRDEFGWTERPENFRDMVPYLRRLIEAHTNIKGAIKELEETIGAGSIPGLLNIRDNIKLYISEAEGRV